MATRLTQAELEVVKQQDPVRYANLEQMYGTPYGVVSAEEAAAQALPPNTAPATVMPTAAPVAPPPAPTTFVPPTMMAQPAPQAPMVINHPQVGYSHRVDEPCVYGLCGNTDAVGSDGMRMGYVSPNKTVLGLPSAEEFNNMTTQQAREIQYISDKAAFGWKFAGPAEMNRAYDQAAIQSNRYRPEWQAEQARLRGDYGDLGAAAIADRRFADAQGQMGVYTGSGVAATNAIELNGIQSNLNALGLSGTDRNGVGMALPGLAGLAPRANNAYDVNGVAVGTQWGDGRNTTLFSQDPARRMYDQARTLNPNAATAVDAQLKTDYVAEITRQKDQAALAKGLALANVGNAGKATVAQINAAPKIPIAALRSATSTANATSRNESRERVATGQNETKKVLKGMPTLRSGSGTGSVVVPADLRRLIRGGQ